MAFVGAVAGAVAGEVAVADADASKLSDDSAIRNMISFCDVLRM